ncbi:hypothetical protein niasHT_010456 [Heterodera trifolii]|uniref:SCP domain-containing protein n=1 Tax=Heterodera trifolii TaxID=157864 RepID=A0ABD2MD38_9BILA
MFLLLTLAFAAFAESSSRSSSSESSESSEECSSEEGNPGTEPETTTVVDSDENCNATSDSPNDESSPVPSSDSPNDESSPVPSSDSPNDESSPVPSSDSPNDESSPVPSSDSPNDESSPVPSSDNPNDESSPVPSSDSPNDESSSVPSTAAPSSPQYTLPVTEEDKNAAVQCHNKFRSELALGNSLNKTGGNKMPSASNMRKMEWDDNLAKFAAEWANKCSISHSWNGWAGENLAMNGGTFTNKDAFEYACGRWWGELAALGFPKDLILTGENFGGIGHWTQMAWANTDRIGCAMAQNCPNTNWKTYVVCWYYAAGNYFGSPVYEAGEPCSKCSPKCDKAIGLCQ